MSASRRFPRSRFQPGSWRANALWPTGGRDEEPGALALKCSDRRASASTSRTCSWKRRALAMLGPQQSPRSIRRVIESSLFFIKMATLARAALYPRAPSGSQSKSRYFAYYKHVAAAIAWRQAGKPPSYRALRREEHGNARKCGRVTPGFKLV